jgi:acylpyruvate hydrolase
VKLASFTVGPTRQPHVGALLDVGGKSYLVELTNAYADHLAPGSTASDGGLISSRRVPRDMRMLLDVSQGDLGPLAAAVAHVKDLLSHGRDPADLSRRELLYSLDAVRLLPSVPRPGKVICSGPNYRSHALELSSAKIIDAVQVPVGFAKFPSALAAHGDDITYPAGTKQLDYEAELAIVIGKTARDVKRADYLEVVAGFTILNDISARDVQFREMKSGMMLLGKNFDGLGSLGPYLVTRDEIANPDDLRVRMRVNDEIRQDFSTKDMIFDCGAMVEHWSQLTLEPGDVIATGTSSGVAIFRENPERYLLRPGDVMEVEIEGIGLLRNRVAAG